MNVSIEEFARQAAASSSSSRPSVVRAAGKVDLANSSGRMIRYLFSDPSVARDNHTIQTWMTDNFMRNPVFLWAHDTKQPPIGKVVEIEQRDGILTGTVEYMDADVYPFADTIFRMVKGEFLNATSTSWDPLKWRLSTDRSRPGGIDFDLVDLMEISQVPVPALPTALATARANGIDTGPIFEWAGKVLDEGGLVMMPRLELEQLRRAAKMPLPARAVTPKTLYVSRPVMNHEEIRTWMREAGFETSLPGEDMYVTIAFSKDALDWSDLSPLDDEITIPASDARSVVSLGDKGAIVLRFEDEGLAARWQSFRDAGASWDFAEYHPHVTLTYSSAPDDVAAYPGEIVLGAERFKEINSNWVDELTEVALPAVDDARSGKGANTMDVADFKRSLYHVSWLANVLADLDCVQSSLNWEKAYQESDSPLPDQLMAAEAALGTILVALVGEEVSKLLESDADDGQPERSAAVSLLRTRAKTAMTHDNARAGKMLSSENAATLDEAYQMIDRGCGMIRALLDKNSGGNSEDDTDAERAIRQRRAKALKLRIASSAA